MKSKNLNLKKNKGYVKIPITEIKETKDNFIIIIPDISKAKELMVSLE